MKAVCKKLFSLMLVAILLVSAVPFQASAEETVAPVTEEPTVATEAAAVEAAAAEIEELPAATEPEVYAGVEMETGVVYVDYQLDSTSDAYSVSQNWQVSLVKSGLGLRASVPSGNTALGVLAKAIGSSAGYEFVRWYYIDGNGAKVTFNSSTVLNCDNMAIEGTVTVKDVSYPSLDVYAEIKTVPVNIVLNANGGTISNTKHKVELKTAYNTYAGLPLPTKAGYTFQGWFKADGTEVTNESIVTDLSNLTAKWNTGRYSVSIQAYNGENTEESVEALNEAFAAPAGFDFYVDNNTVLKAAFSNFPSEAQIKELFKAAGWTIDGWEYSADGGDTWKTFTEGKTKITANTIIRPLYKKDIKLVANDNGNTTRTLTVTLGKRVPVLPNPGTRETTNAEGKTVNQAFVGWWGNGKLICNRDNLSNVSAHPVYTPAMGDTFVAGWKDACTVYLYIHTNGNTEEHTKLVKYYDVPVTGFDLTKIDLADIFPNYGKYDDKGDEKWGWYNPAQWENYCLGRHKYDTTEYVDADYLNPERDDVHEFYIMLIDNGNNASSGSTNGNGYNDNKTTVDSSNPSTGDDIFVTVAIMAVSACAVLLMFMNKKRFVK